MNNNQMNVKVDSKPVYYSTMAVNQIFGASLKDLVDASIDLARKFNCEVKLSFNGVEMSVERYSKREEILSYYHKCISKQLNENKIKELQNEVNKLKSQLKESNAQSMKLIKLLRSKSNKEQKWQDNIILDLDEETKKSIFSILYGGRYIL